MPDKIDITAIYVALPGQIDTAPAAHALKALRADCTRLVIVTAAQDHDSAMVFQPDEILTGSDATTSYLAGIKQGLLAEMTRREAVAGGGENQQGPILVTGAHVLGPLVPIQVCIDQLLAPSEGNANGAGLFSSYWHNTKLDLHISSRGLPDRLPSLDFAIFAPALLTAPGFRTLWEKMRLSYKQSDLTLGLGPMAIFLDTWRSDDKATLYPLPKNRLLTSDPRLYEVHRLVEEGAPVLPLEVFSLDPLEHDMAAMDFRRALDAMRMHHPDLYRVAIEYATSHVRMREFNACADQFEVLPITPNNPEKTSWSFGKVAVFIHVYYPEMIDELAGLAQKIPGGFDLFISTASQESQDIIQTRLDAMGFARETVEIRVVAQNRGRDMPALFITFRDVILEDRYQIALRLHSKRTLQVSDRVSESYRAHLFENLLATPGYIANLLDLFEAEPDIGMFIPPVIHVGFGTLGHSWFNNRDRVEKLTHDLGLQVPLDTSTPVAPYGGMFWFRTDALRKMFEWPWQWEEYNPEPHHIDGGLAHVQERLICYCAQDKHYRVMSVMTAKEAARNYARLEYKLQRIAAHLPTTNIIMQDQILATGSLRFRGRLYQTARRIYGKMIIRWPDTAAKLRPLGKLINRLLASSPAR